MRRKIDLKSSALLKALHQECGVSCAELCRRYKQFAPRSIYRHATAKGSCEDRRHANPGRPRKLDCRDERLIVRTLKRLRKERASFSAKKIQEETALFHVSLKTIHRTLRKFGYKYRQSRKKGLLSQLDKVKRLQYARRVKRFGQQFWEEEICFYFDGVGFAHRGNPYAEARAVSSMAWRKPGEGLSITTKGRKEGSCGKMANFFVGISHGSGVVLCKQHNWQVTGERFAEFITEFFPGEKKL